jgi:hypothetical protein
MPWISTDTIRASVRGARHSGFFREIDLPDPKNPFGGLPAPLGTAVEVHEREAGLRRFFLLVAYPPSPVRGISPVHAEQWTLSAGQWRVCRVCRPWQDVAASDVPAALLELAQGGGFETPLEQRELYAVVDRTGAVVALRDRDGVDHPPSVAPRRRQHISLARCRWPDGAERAIFVPGYCDDVAYLEPA